MNCTRCDGSGFINLDQIPEADMELIEKYEDFVVGVQTWMNDHKDSDVAICDCCGDGEGWHGEPGQHYTSEDPMGHNGPYAYNGGLCECH